MTAKPSYEELVQRVEDLEHSLSEHNLIVETLRKSEEKYSRLFQNSNDGICIHDLEGNILDANQKVLELFGYTKDEISGLKISMLHPAEALEKSKWAFGPIVRDGFVRFRFRQVYLRQTVTKLSRVLYGTLHFVNWQSKRCGTAKINTGFLQKIPLISFIR
ncbi:MAG: PAS domain S-box protein [Desulfobacterales bacterium]